MKFFATVSGEIKFGDDKDFDDKTNKLHLKDEIYKALMKDNLGGVTIDGVLDISLMDE